MFTSSSASVSSCAVLAAAVLAVAASGCATTDETFRVIVGASLIKSDIRPCADYASSYNYLGTPYYVFVAETRKVTTRHEGMDFCANAGSEVLAPAKGIVVEIVQDNPHRGGRVTIRTTIKFRQRPSIDSEDTLYLDVNHITPKEGLQIGDTVKAGQAIGYVQPAGKAEIGPLPHVHLSAGPIPQTWNTHTDPNRFWQKGPGVVTCFDPKSPPDDSQIVAPIRCLVGR